MKEFIVSLYSNEKFPMYLGIFIIILVIAFVIVFFLGKKDQKLIETQKLRKIDLDETKPLNPVEESINKDKEKGFIPGEELPLDLPQKEYVDAFKMDNQIDTLELDLPAIKAAYRPENIDFEYTKTLELPRLNASEKKMETVNIEDFARLADSISVELDNIEEYQKNIKDENFVDTMFEEETLDIDLPRLADFPTEPVNEFSQAFPDTSEDLYEETLEIDLPKMKR